MVVEFTFSCCYCGHDIAARPAQAECIVQCAACGRSVLAPPPSSAALWSMPIAAERRSRWPAVLVTLLAALMGGLLIGGMALGVVYYFSLSVIGINLQDAILMGAVGLAFGAFGFGLLAWNLCSR